MVVLNKLQIRQMKKLNEKIWKGKSAEECQLWLEHNPETFELLKNEQTLDSEENYFYSPVHKAVYEQRYDVIQTMKTLNINIDVTQRWLNKDQSVSFFTPLHLAVSLQNIEMAKLLLVCMAQPNKRGEWNENKGTPLHWALQDDQSPEIIKLLSNWPDVAPAEQCVLELIRSKEDKKRQLKAAKCHQNKIRVKQRAWEDQEKIWQAKFDELQKKYDEDKSRHEKELEDMKKDPKYLTEVQRSQLKREIQNDKDLEQKLRTYLGSQSNSAHVKIECIICFQRPEGKIFRCSECDHIFCESCKHQINRCGMCRYKFSGQEPKRARFAERLLNNDRSTED